jgi:hypothetical protein
MLSDLAEKVATEMEIEALAPVNDEVIENDPLDGETKSILSRIKFAFRSHDKEIHQRIEGASDAQFIQLFADPVAVVDNFYARMRVPETTQAGTAVIGPDGRQVFKRDEQGRYIESIDQLTGQDIDTAILELQRLLLEISPQIEQLMLDAVMAHNIARDVYDDAWFGVVEGTQGDRTARSNRESRQDRWHAFFRLYLYRRAKSFYSELEAFAARLDKIAQRQSFRER